MVNFTIKNKRAIANGVIHGCLMPDPEQPHGYRLFTFDGVLYPLSEPPREKAIALLEQGANVGWWVVWVKTDEAGNLSVCPVGQVPGDDEETNNLFHINGKLIYANKDKIVLLVVPRSEAVEKFAIVIYGEHPYMEINKYYQVKATREGDRLKFLGVC